MAVRDTRPPFVGSREREVLDKLDVDLKRFLPDQLTDMQLRCVPHLFTTDDNFVLSAPTGSGKSWVLAFAILKELMPNPTKRCMYIAPTRALCEQQSAWLNEVLELTGLKTVPLTGDTDVAAQSSLIKKANVLVFTPEKFDALSRRWSELKEIYASCTLLLIDEVHLLSESRRGAVLECIVSRLRTVKQSLWQTSPDMCQRTVTGTSLLRIGAVSATVPNLSDLGNWLQVPRPNGLLSFGKEFRPVPLEVIIQPYPRNGKNEFLFERDLDLMVPSVISRYGFGKQTLIFCTSRKGTKSLAELLASKQLLIKDHTNSADQRHREFCLRIQDTSLRSCAYSGIGWHHSQLSPCDRSTVEEMFREGLLVILTCTTTLALGMNLPASLVIVRSTKAYRGATAGMQDIDKSTMIQMVGRAGRPGFDSNGTAVIMTSFDEEKKLNNLLNGLEPITSVLKYELKEILNTEIVLGFISSIEDSLVWLETTFWYQLEKKKQNIKEKLRNVVVQSLHELVKLECVKWSDDACTVFSTNIGVLMCRRYIKADTMKAFGQLDPNTGDYDSILRTLSHASEFSDMVLRRNQKQWLNQVNWELGRFTQPRKERVKTIQQKTFQLFQAILGKITPPDRTLVQEIFKVSKEGPRILDALFSYLANVKKSAIATKAFVLVRSLKLKSWSDNELGQLPHIGPKVMGKLHSLGVFSLDDFLNNITLISDVLGTKISERVKASAQHIVDGRVQVRATLAESNGATIFLEGRTRRKGYCIFIVQNHSLLCHVMKVGAGFSLRIPKANPNLPIYVYVIHQHYHGLDISIVLPPIGNQPIRKKMKTCNNL